MTPNLPKHQSRNDVMAVGFGSIIQCNSIFYLFSLELGITLETADSSQSIKYLQYGYQTHSIFIHSIDDIKVKTMVKQKQLHPILAQGTLNQSANWI
jgi:hypothetical protein